MVVVIQRSQVKHERRPTPGPRTPVTPRVRCRHRLVAAYQLSVPLVQQPGGEGQRQRSNFLFTSVPIRGGKQISLSVLCLSQLGCRVSGAGSRGARDTPPDNDAPLWYAQLQRRCIRIREVTKISKSSASVGRVLRFAKAANAIGQARLGQPGSLLRSCGPAGWWRPHTGLKQVPGCKPTFWPRFPALRSIQQSFIRTNRRRCGVDSVRHGLSLCGGTRSSVQPMAVTARADFAVDRTSSGTSDRDKQTFKDNTRASRVRRPVTCALRPPQT